MRGAWGRWQRTKDSTQETWESARDTAYRCGLPALRQRRHARRCPPSAFPSSPSLCPAPCPCPACLPSPPLQRLRRRNLGLPADVGRRQGRRPPALGRDQGQDGTGQRGRLQAAATGDGNWVTGGWRRLGGCTAAPAAPCPLCSPPLPHPCSTPPRPQTWDDASRAAWDAWWGARAYAGGSWKDAQRDAERYWRDTKGGWGPPGGLGRLSAGWLCLLVGSVAGGRQAMLPALFSHPRPHLLPHRPPSPPATNATNVRRQGERGLR